MKRVESKMSVLATIGRSTHEVPTKTMKRFGIAGLGEDVGDVVARANVVERQGIVNHRMMINKGVRDSKMAKAAKIPATTRDMNAPLIVFVDRSGRQIADVKIGEQTTQIHTGASAATRSDQLSLGSAVRNSTLLAGVRQDGTTVEIENRARSAPGIVVVGVVGVDHADQW